MAITTMKNKIVIRKTEQNIETLTEILANDAKKVASSLDFRDLASKSIMVTGANGLIGINFLASLIEISINISGIKIYPVIHSSPTEFLLPFLRFNNVTVFQGDLTDENFLTTLPNADIIIHAAGSGTPSNFLINKLSSLKINTITTFKLLEKLELNGRFLFISSSDLYNGLNSGSFSEDQIGTTNTNHPRACYIEGKRTGETICNIYREMGVKAYSVRLSLTYGPGVYLNDERVLPSFIRKALDGKIDLLDSGEGTRTFCYISDAIELMWYVLLFGKHSQYNIGGTDNIKIIHLAHLIGGKLNVPIIHPSISYSIDGAPQHVHIDINRVLLESKKKTFIDLDVGLTNTINWLKQLKNLQS